MLGSPNDLFYIIIPMHTHDAQGDNICIYVYEPQYEKMYQSPKNSKMIFFQKCDYTSLNYYLEKFDSNVMMVNG